MAAAAAAAAACVNFEQTLAGKLTKQTPSGERTHTTARETRNKLDILQRHGTVYKDKTLTLYFFLVLSLK